MKVIKAVWLLLCFAVLVLFLLHERGWRDAELATLSYMRTLLLTFPLGLVAATSVGYLLSFVDGLHQKVEFFVTWISMVGLGYLQWFHLVPGLYARFKQWRSAAGRG